MIAVQVPAVTSRIGPATAVSLPAFAWIARYADGWLSTPAGLDARAGA